MLMSSPKRKLLPRQATPEMLQAMQDSTKEGMGGFSYQKAWQAGYDAGPHILGAEFSENICNLLMALSHAVMHPDGRMYFESGQKASDVRKYMQLCMNPATAA